MTTSLAYLPHPSVKRASLITASTTTMKGLLKVALCNDNSAIFCFSKGSLSNAKQSFVMALRELKASSQNKGHLDQQHQTTPTYKDLAGNVLANGTSPADCTVKEQGNFARAISVASTKVNPQSQDMPLFDKAFLLQGADVPCDQTATAAVLLFNTGLLHHTEGLLTECTNSFRRAVSFYKKALTILSQQQDMLYSSKTLLLVLCATLHNLSHCCSREFSPTAQQYLNQLRDLLDWATTSNPGSCMASCDLEFFYSAMMFKDLQSKACKVAAAA